MTSETINYNGRNYTYCAKEGEICAIHPTNVRSSIKYIYGKQGTVNEYPHSIVLNPDDDVNTMECNNGNFGGDPTPGYPKSCYYNQSPYTEISEENDDIHRLPYGDTDGNNDETDNKDNKKNDDDPRTRVIQISMLVLLIVVFIIILYLYFKK
jgi:hypothetical protein